MSDPVDVGRAAELLDAALKEAPGRRAAFIRERVGDDDALRDEVLSLLVHHGDSDGFLETPAVVLEKAPDDDGLPERIGRYHVLARIGAGGMGVVYLAEQDQPRRQVAIKLLRQAVATPETRRRFEYEGEILGRLQHPGIAQIHEAATTESAEGPQAFLVMEYVVGLSLVDYADEHKLSVRERLRLLIAVCGAVQHAHQQGVIHRDLKPANILVTPNGQPKVLDFGVARVVDPEHQATQLTGAGQIVGTLAYMSPEQAAGDPTRVDTRTDVYALGVISYELLTGVRPHAVDGLALPAALRLLQETEPPRLGALRRELRGDVETIVAKALARERRRRYPSVSQLASDLRHYLADEPIAAHPPSTLYQWKKLARRHRVLVGSAALILVILVAAVAVTGSLALELREQRDEARVAEARAADEADEATAIALFLEDVFASAEPYVGKHDATVAEALDFASAEIDERFADRPELAAALHGRIASVFYSRGQLEEALREARAALAIQGGAETVAPLVLAASQAEAGGVLQLQGKVAEANASLREAVTIFQELDARDDPAYLTALVNLGALLYHEGSYAEAEPLLREALAKRRVVFGDEHPYTLTAQNNLANLLRKTDRIEEAMRLLRELMEVSRRTLTTHHPNTITSIYNYADLLRELGRHEEAEELYLEAIELATTYLPQGHWQQGLFTSRYGELLTTLERFEEAEELLLVGHAVLDHALGAEHDRTQRVIDALVTLYTTWKPAEAEAWRGRTPASRR